MFFVLATSGRLWFSRFIGKMTGNALMLACSGHAAQHFECAAENGEFTETGMHVEGSSVNLHPEAGECAGMLDANSIMQVIEHPGRERGLKPGFTAAS